MYVPSMYVGADVQYVRVVLLARWVMCTIAASRGLSRARAVGRQAVCMYPYLHLVNCIRAACCVLSPLRVLPPTVQCVFGGDLLRAPDGIVLVLLVRHVCLLVPPSLSACLPVSLSSFPPPDA